MKTFFITTSLALALLFGCDSQNEKPTPQSEKSPAKVDASTVEANPILTQPQKAELVEIPSEALPVWRQHRSQRPTLILFSSDPLLQPVPAQLQAEVQELVDSGSTEDIRAKGPFTATTTLLPGQTLRAALQAGFFADVIWVIPHQKPQQPIDTKLFSDQLVTMEAITKAEAKTIKQTQGGFSATFFNTPFQIIREAYLPESKAAAVIHLDLTYFRDLYRSEIKTPIYQIIHQTLTTLRNSGWKSLAVTVSLNNLMDVIPLDKRFIGPTLVRVFKDPQLLDQAPPANWKLREDALYLDNFFQPEKIRDLYLKMEQNSPSDPSIQYGLYRTALSFKAVAPAMEYLARAVAVDPGYGKEYLDIALESEQSNPLRAVELLKQAARAFPTNPLIKLRMMQNLLKGGEKSQAQELLNELRAMDWSPVYSAEVPKYLQQVAMQIDKDNG